MAWSIRPKARAPKEIPTCRLHPTTCRIRSSKTFTTSGDCEVESFMYATVGVEGGRHARVLARHPHGQPRFVEVEHDGVRLVTLPITYAQQVLVESPTTIRF